MNEIRQLRPPVSVGASVRRFGYNSDVDVSTGPSEAIVATGGDAYFPDGVIAAGDIDIASTSANDASGGTGVRTMRIEGLDADWLYQFETITLNGVTAVNPVNDYRRIFGARALSVGSNGSAVGNISISDATATFLTLIASFNASLTTSYTVPADYKFGYLLKYDFGLVNKSSAYIVGVIEVRELGGVFYEIDIFSVSEASDYRQQFVMPLRFPAKTDFRIRAIDASADNLEARAGYELYLR